MEVNKQLVTKALCLAVILAGMEVKDMDYFMRDDYEEFVVITYRNGYTKKVNVSADSGIALMRDVLAEIR